MEELSTYFAEKIALTKQIRELVKGDPEETQVLGLIFFCHSLRLFRQYYLN